ncbi:MAG: hypothetical protein IJ995_05070 [Clostridia bacterium]|nr:hypothetical protein [Clostridia bacterium]
MKRIIAVLLMLMLVLSGCAKPDQPQQEAGATQDQPASEQEQGLENPEEEPHVDPKIDPQWKDPSITDEQRRWFFDLVKGYRVDAMYDFDAEHPMELDWFKYYCAYFVKEEDKTYVDMGVSYSGKAVEGIAERFGVTYGLADDDQVFVKAGSLLDAPFAELIQYKEEVVDGKTLITARCINYGFNRYIGDDRVESRATYPADRAMVLKGEVKGFDRYSIIDVAFYTEDGKTPSQFVSAMEYHMFSIEDGSATVPEF